MFNFLWINTSFSSVWCKLDERNVIWRPIICSYLWSYCGKFSAVIETECLVYWTSLLTLYECATACGRPSSVMDQSTTWYKLFEINKNNNNIFEIEGTCNVGKQQTLLNPYYSYGFSHTYWYTISYGYSPFYIWSAWADPESFARGGPILTTFFFLMRGKRIQITLKAGHPLQRNAGGPMMGTTLNAGLVALWIFMGSRPVLLRNPIFLWFFQEGSGSPVPHPSGSALSSFQIFIEVLFDLSKLTFEVFKEQLGHASAVETKVASSTKEILAKLKTGLLETTEDMNWHI